MREYPNWVGTQIRHQSLLQNIDQIFFQDCMIFLCCFHHLATILLYFLKFRVSIIGHENCLENLFQKIFTIRYLLMRKKKTKTKQSKTKNPRFYAIYLHVHAGVLMCLTYLCTKFSQNVCFLLQILF